MSEETPPKKGVSVPTARKAHSAANKIKEQAPNAAGSLQHNWKNVGPHLKKR